MTSCIYAILNLNNQLHYIGSAVNLKKRIRLHLSGWRNGNHHNRKLQNVFNKYGESVFRFDIIEVVLDPQDLLKREQFWIDATLPYYNHARIAGSALGTKRTKEQIARMCVAQKLSKSRPEVREKLRISNIGIKKPPVTEANKEKMRALYKGIPLTKEHAKKISEALMGKPGRSPSEETRKLLSNRNKGRVQSDEVKEKMRLIMLLRRGSTHTEESIQKMRVAKQKYVYFITAPSGETYNTGDLKEFSKQHGLGYQTMCRIARGVFEQRNGWYVVRKNIEDVLPTDAML